MKKIKNSKEAVNFVLGGGKQYLTSINKKAVSKLFSLAVEILEGEFNAYTKDDYLYIEGYVNGHLLTFKIQRLIGESYWSEIPTKFTPIKVVFDSGIIWTPVYRRDYKWVKVGEKYLELPLNHSKILSIVSNYSNIKGVFLERTYALDDALKSNRDSWFTSNSDYPYRELRVCTKKFFPGINVGDVFKITENYFYARETYRSVFENLYSTFQKYTVNLLEEVPSPEMYNISCEKGKYGCHRGCYNSCAAKEQNRKNRTLYREFNEWRNKLLKQIEDEKE